MNAAQFDIVVEQGSVYRMVITVVGGPTDIGDCEGAMQIRPTKPSTEVYAEAAPGDFTMDGPNRQIQIQIPSSATALYDWDEGYYDVLVTDSGGNSWRIVEGRARLSGSVTRED